MFVRVLIDKSVSESDCTLYGATLGVGCDLTVVKISLAETHQLMRSQAEGHVLMKRRAKL